MNKPTMRTESSKQGLKSMIDYINQFENTKEMFLVEIGSYDGTSARIFAERFKHVLCIDPWDDAVEKICGYPMDLVYKDFLAVKEKFENIYHIKNTSEYVANNWSVYNMISGSIPDIIYIDGMHKYWNVKQDIGLWRKIVRTDGWITGHDYRPGKFGDVVRAVNECLKKPDAIFVDYSWAKRMKK